MKRHPPKMRRKLEFKRKDGWMIRNVRVDDCKMINSFLQRQKGIGRPWGLI
jgi:hypothetical protein